jgi:hypothetical protein
MSNNDLTDNGQTFNFGYNSQTDEMGYYKKVAGADTFFPFKEGKMSETVLWTNPNPASSIAQQIKNLDNGKFSDYDYIKVVFKGGSSTAGKSHEVSAIMQRDEFELTADVNWGNYLCCAMRANNYSYIRRIWYATDTSFHIGTGQRTTDAVTSNDSVIPYQVIGMKIS